MLSKPAILVFSTIATLAVAFSQLGAPLARHRERRQVPSDQRPVTWPQFSYLITAQNWAGAGWAQEAQTFRTVTGTFTVPEPQDDAYGVGSIWVGIDGITCENIILQTGIDFTFNGGQGSYKAWYEWYPADLLPFDPDVISVNGGDRIRLTVTAITSVAGTAFIENLTTQQQAWQYITSSDSLCLQDAEWVIETIEYKNIPGEYAPLGNYGTVTFTAAIATGFNGVTYGPDGATNLIYLEQEGVLLSSVSTRRNSLTIKYHVVSDCF